jgi:propanol-preferring alcohol dehydrogenase
MKAMLLQGVSNLQQNPEPLSYTEIREEAPGTREILLKVSACGVCHTELDEIEGRTPPPQYPVVPGHQVVGKVVATGENAHRFRMGDRVGVAWIFYARVVQILSRR